ncbi:MAG: PilZ domain-containing protein [Spirochaetales bacterium]
MGVFIIVLLVLAALFFFFVQRGGGFGFPWMEFYVRGKESGFKIREINLLRHVAVDNKLKDPASLFWSERVLDRCLRGTIIRFRARNQMQNPKALDFLNKLFDFRKQVEFSLPKYRVGLRSTRNIPPGQRIRIPFAGGGVYESQVVENMRKYLAIAYPKGKVLPPGFSWEGQKIQVYFWRAEDAGYYFESKVIGDYLDRKYPILHITHSDNLIRNQRRGSIRAPISCAASLYPLKSISEANEVPESSPGYRCKMLDLSEDGFACIVGGQAKAGLPVKIQFELEGELIVMCGTVKGVTFNQQKKQSILHVQAVKPSIPIKLNILTYVYGLFKDSTPTPSTKESLPSKPINQPEGSKVQEGATGSPA